MDNRNIEKKLDYLCKVGPFDYSIEIEVIGLIDEFLS